MKKDQKQKTTMMDGKINCSVYGDMTGTDCGCMQDEKFCGECFIFNAVKNVAAELSGEILEGVSSSEH